MSRKSRQKKKNKIKLQKKINQQMPEVVEESTDLELEENESLTIKRKSKKEKVETEDEIIDLQTKKFILKDVRLIIYTLLGLAVILTIIKILQLKTGYITNLGDWLYKIFNINTG